MHSPKHPLNEDGVKFTKSIVEYAALTWLEALGYSALHGPDIATGEPGASAAIRTTATWCSTGDFARRSSA